MLLTAIGRKPIGIERLLEWSFGAERAELEPDLHERFSGSEWVSMEMVLIERARLGCKIDGSGPGLFGGYDVAWDAEAVASVVRGVLDWSTATMVASYARAGTRPSAMVGAVPKVQPAEWNENQHGRSAKCEPAIPSKWPGGAWRPAMAKRKGRDRFEGYVTPIVFNPSPQQIAAHRWEYIRWWTALHDIREHLIEVGVLIEHRLTREMPPAIPWKDEAMGLGNERGKEGVDGDRLYALQSPSAEERRIELEDRAAQANERAAMARAYQPLRPTRLSSKAS